MDDKTRQRYTDILTSQLVPAMGCTEPVAVAFAAVKLREVLGAFPDTLLVEVSPNIIKNAKSVVVPHTGGLKGIEAAAAAGLVAGDASRELDVLAGTDAADYPRIEECAGSGIITVKPLSADSESYMRIAGGAAPALFEMILTGEADGHHAVVHVREKHTHIVYIERDGEALTDERDGDGGITSAGADAAISSSTEEDMTVAQILDYIREVPIEEISPLIKRQIEYNTAIAEEGLAQDYGANIGSVLLASHQPDPPVSVCAKAMAAAGSDARMSGCEKPVIIVCGSGNQGMTASLPIAEYAKEYQVDRERLIRAVALSDLMAIHLKSGIGTLSAFCGAVCAGCGAGAGIAYLLGGDDHLICHTFVNALAIISGMICDGAKPSCAAKIAASVDAGILGYEMAKNGQEFYSGEGIITKGIEGNIRNIGRLGRLGMEETDKEIMRIMFSEPSC